MATLARQPFGDLSTPRLQALGSSKNRQNALSPSMSSFACPLKPSAASSMGKRQREPEMFEDDDGENMDPAAFSSPTKKPRSSSHVYAKPARPAMLASPARSNATLTASPAASMPSIRKALSSPNTAKSTPISHSRGSPKNKRLHAPPTAAPPPACTLSDSMPQSWFFAIHEDTPEQEAANHMEHSASVLDISSDDDAHAKARTVDALRGKENIPPLDFVLPLPTLPADETDVEDAPKHARRGRSARDAMDEDRRPLGDLPPSEFYADGCDAGSFVTVEEDPIAAPTLPAELAATPSPPPSSPPQPHPDSART
ncbi:hypothetical protein EJ07DRAFT_162898 [Lizonia empirigonia]|nr:hypothetical protein EJ07DRAFT_162898 [Lizonia empirigonia]